MSVAAGGSPSELPSWIEPVVEPEPAGHAWRHAGCGTLNDGRWRQGDYCGCGLVVARGEGVQPYRLVAEAFHG